MHTYGTVDLFYSKKHHDCYFGVPDVTIGLSQCRYICNYMRDTLGIELELEEISEGGLIFKDLYYKSIRFSSSRGYPWIKDKSTQQGEFSLNGKRGKVRVFLKAFYDAPPFTQEEIETLQKAIWEIVFVPSEQLSETWKMYKQPALK